MPQPKNNKNVTALFIGFGLIILIAVFTIFKPFSHTKNNSGQSASPASPSADAKQISANDLLKKIRNKESLAIIDVRSSDAFAAEHILDSQNIPADSFDSGSQQLDKNKTYVLVDDGSDNAGSILAAYLARQVFKNVSYLTGGFSGWKDNAGPAVSAGDPASFADQSKVTYISSDQLKQLMQGENALYLIDVRKSNAYAQGHLKGAVNIFLDDLEKRRGEIPISKKIILYDADGMWAFQGAVRLFDMDVFNVSALSDGFNTWTQKGYEVVK